MDVVMTRKAVRLLGMRAPLPVDPRRSIAVKRDVHEFVVETDAATFARAFREVVTDPASTFGLIRVKRPEDRVGREFQVGERFQGCFSLRRAAEQRLGRVAALLDAPAARRIVSWLEDQLLSNYAEVVDIVEGETFTLEYRYLDGTPIAGRSIFTIEPLARGRCRVRQIFEYQEVNGVALGTFQRFGLKAHDGVVRAEIEKAAARAGARVASGTIPPEYAA